jgi:uncharacterized protein YggT (Ycf19 family)
MYPFHFLIFVVRGILELVVWAIIISAVLSWLVAFNVINVRHQFVYNVVRVLDAMTRPILRPFQRIIPPLGNEFIAMLKDSSLGSVIGFEELTRSGQLIIAETYGSLEIWTAVALLYLIMTLTITQFVGVLERRYKKSDAR